MIKKILFFLLISAPVIGFGQKSMTFKVKVMPNKVYTTEIKTVTEAEVDFIADQAILDGIKSQGMELPMKTLGENLVVTQVTTQDRQENGDLPAIMKFTKMTQSITMNGETKSEKQPLEGMTILGKYDQDSKFSLDTILGENVSPLLQQTLKSTLEGLQEKIEFPEHPLKIGDSFTNDVPMSIPMQGMNPINMNIRTKYTLTSIKDENGYFDVDMDVSLDSDQEQFNIEASGSGDGTAIFNVNTGYLMQMNSSMPMNMKMVMNEQMTLVMKMTARSEQKVVIE